MSDPAPARSFPCRACRSPVSRLFVDLGFTPLSNELWSAEDLQRPRTVYPLRAYVCDACRLVQIEDVAGRGAHFHGEYVYFSSFATTWLDHARRYAETMIGRLGLDGRSLVVEVASNDGYLLQYFQRAGVPCLGIDPAANCAAAARETHGLTTVVDFFGRGLAEKLRREGYRADLIVANNVLAHVPDLDDFVAGFTVLLKGTGTATFEFPHLLELIRKTEFDTIYHEHYSYLSLCAVEPLFARHGLAVTHVERLATHGGSLRLFVQPAGATELPSNAVSALRDEEERAGLQTPVPYDAFPEQVATYRRELLSLLFRLKDESKRIVAYGAPAKGNTLLNACGVRPDLIAYTVDRNPAKQNRFLPGSCIPVHAPDKIRQDRPDYVLILPWNLTDEITAEFEDIRSWGGRFVVPIPKPRILP